VAGVRWKTLAGIASATVCWSSDFVRTFVQWFLQEFTGLSGGPRMRSRTQSAIGSFRAASRGARERHQGKVTAVGEEIDSQASVRHGARVWPKPLSMCCLSVVLRVRTGVRHGSDPECGKRPDAWRCLTGTGCQRGFWRHPVPAFRRKRAGGVRHRGHSSQENVVRRTKMQFVAAVQFQRKAIRPRATNRSGIRVSFVAWDDDSSQRFSCVVSPVSLSCATNPREQERVLARLPTGRRHGFGRHAS
jgi:hypothetical protein